MSTYLVAGTDPILRSRALQDLVDELLNGEDRSLAVENLTLPGKADEGSSEGREAVIEAALTAAQSPPFMTSCRIVILRDYEHMTADDAAPLITYLGNPLETTELVFVAGGGGRVTKVLADALKSARKVGPESEKTLDVLEAARRDAGISFKGGAAKLVVDHLGEDAGRVGALVEVLAATFGSGAVLEVADVEPYLGGAGSVPAYTLTNSIEGGDVAGALETLNRLLNVTSPRQPKPMHPLQILGMITARFRRLLILDDPKISTEKQAHEALGGKGSSYPAKKGLEVVQGLGSDGLRKAFDLLHQADLDLKGASALGAEGVIEILVARLTGLCSRGRGGSSGQRSGSSSSSRAGSRSAPRR